MSDEVDTLILLKRWHDGDQLALSALVARDLPWLQTEVRRRMGAELRARTDADDIVQQALLTVMRDGPRFLVGDCDHYRALLLRIVENTIRKQIRLHRQQRRAAAREEPLPSGSVVALQASVTRPSAVADRNERRAWVQLALELVAEPDREIILLRQWEGLTFAEVGEKLSLSEDACRMRFERAVARLARVVQQLRSGQLQSVLRR